MIFDLLQVEGKMQRSRKHINPCRFSPILEIVPNRASSATFGILTISYEKQHISQSHLHATFEN